MLHNFRHVLIYILTVILVLYIYPRYVTKYIS